ncbi:flagellar biosynthesis anti-sigma factor FlgM [Hathewaya histolytica]|uniref:Flagellar biosynthesis anti-sigma factor FlgM n=1 Tax=Hathewaya histolytica TaxID=1498 RepID=A0A4U9R7S6_HATHI|nr:flagellar biosynthesis anti-sigma factor FlgM [Hathewaya histolytica]VTQ87582.1 flagellar biosynthesis anti-sigma factor FlgM [Hathewaya histolytica]
MKVNNISMNKLINLYDRKNQYNNTKKSTLERDRIELSDIGKKLSVENRNEIIDKERENRIREIKNQIEKGTYNRDSRLIAEKILDNIKGKNI